MAGSRSTRSGENSQRSAKRPSRRAKRESGISPKTGRPKKRVGHATAGSWKPGQSGNPAGRPPLPDEYKDSIKALAKKGLQALDAILDNPRHFRHEQACEYVVNRAHGTPTVRAEISGPDGGPVQVANLTTAERLARLQQLEAEAAAGEE